MNETRSLLEIIGEVEIWTADPACQIINKLKGQNLKSQGKWLIPCVAQC